ncbi:hypothetical protein [Serratia marcescens]|uniref:hypothetical protein n=1 Tax=Serratia marcescens TaxID=615 RepID=UPI003D788BF1
MLIFSSAVALLVESNTALYLGNGAYFSIKEQQGNIALETPVKFWGKVQNGLQPTVPSTKDVSKMAAAAK